MTKDNEFLNWLADRLVHVYGESPNVDFVHKLREIAKNATWQEETAAVKAAFDRSCVKRTHSDDEPGQIIPMVNAMVDEIELLRGYRDEAEADAAIAGLLVDKLRLTDEEVAMLKAFRGSDYIMPRGIETIDGMLERLGGGK